LDGYNIVPTPGGAVLARINIEDSIYKDIRFYDLLQKIGGMDAALGALVRAWSVAQDYWIANGVGIPIPIWKSQRLRPELIEVGFAEERGDFIYISGSEEQFSWLHDKAKAGKNGGLAKARNHKEKALAEASSSYKSLASSSSSSSSQEKKNIKQEDLEPCFIAWGETLDRFGIKKDPRTDEFTILRLATTHGIEKTELALRGCGHQTGFDKYNPAKFCRITQLLKPDKFELCVNLGAQQTKPEWELASDAVQPDQ
jgi:hypothetical protein